MTGSAPDTPTISVAIAAYNAEKWIAETLDSILGQTLPAYEIVVVDDGSTDGTLAVLDAYRDRIRLFGQENAGVSAALNRCFAEATGDYVALCGADDLWEPQKLEWQAESLAAHPEIGVAFGHARMFGIIEREFARPDGTGILDGDELALRLYEGNMIAAPSAVIRRSLHAELGGFREDLAGEDYEFWLNALRHGAVFHYEPRRILLYRRHGENMSMPGALRDDRLRPLLEMNCVVHREYADLVSARTARRILARDHCDLGRFLAEAGTPKDARTALHASLRTRPSLRAVIWLVLLRLGPSRRERVVDAIVAAQRAAHGAAARVRVAVSGR
jgi:hypothetical protein